jgi:hypothetical protein
MATEPEDRVQSAHAFSLRLAPYLSHPPPYSVPHGPRSADAFLLQPGLRGSEGPLSSDMPGMSRAPRDFPSFDLAKIVGKPRGETLADSLLQSPIIPKAPGAARIQLFDGTRDLESWSTAPPVRVREDEDDELSEPETSVKVANTSLGTPSSFEEDVLPKHPLWPRAAWVTALGVGVGAALAWLYQLG